MPIGEYCGSWGGGGGGLFRKGGGHGGGGMALGGLGETVEGILGENEVSAKLASFWFSPNEESEFLEGVSLSNVEELELEVLIVALVVADEAKLKGATRATGGRGGGGGGRGGRGVECCGDGDFFDTSMGMSDVSLRLPAEALESLAFGEWESTKE